MESKKLTSIIATLALVYGLSTPEVKANDEINLSPNPYHWTGKISSDILSYHNLTDKPIGYDRDGTGRGFRPKGHFVTGMDVWGKLTGLKVGDNEVEYVSFKGAKNFDGEVRIDVDPYYYNVEIDNYGGLVNMVVDRLDGSVYNLSLTKNNSYQKMSEKQIKEMGILGGNIWQYLGKDESERLKSDLYPDEVKKN